METGKITNRMDLEFMNGQKNKDIKADGAMDLSMEKVISHLTTEVITKVVSYSTKSMVLDSITTMPK